MNTMFHCSHTVLFQMLGIGMRKENASKFSAWRVSIDFYTYMAHLLGKAAFSVEMCSFMQNDKANTRQEWRQVCDAPEGRIAGGNLPYVLDWQDYPAKRLKDALLAGFYLLGQRSKCAMTAIA